MLRSSLWAGLGLVAAGLSRLGLSAVALAAFGGEAAGALHVALSSAMLAALVGVSALSAPAVRFVAEAWGRGDEPLAGALVVRFFGAALGLGAVSGVLAVALSGRLGLSWTAETAVSEILLPRSAQLEESLGAAIFTVVVGQVSYQVGRGLLFAVEAARASALYELLSAALFALLLGAGVAAGSPALALAAYGLGQLTYAALAFARRPRRWRAPAPIAAGPIAGFASFGVLGSVSSLAPRELAVILAGSVAGPAAAAHLGLSLSLLAPLGFLPRMLRTVVFAAAAGAADAARRDRLTSELGALSHALVVVQLPLAAAALAASGALLAWLGDAPTATDVRALEVLVLAGTVEVLAAPATNALPGLGRVALTAGAAALGLALAAPGLALARSTSELAVALLVSSVVKGSIPIAALAMTHRVMLTTRLGLGAVLSGIVVGLAAVDPPAPVAALLALLSLALAGPEARRIAQRWQRGQK